MIDVHCHHMRLEKLNEKFLNDIRVRNYLCSIGLIGKKEMLGLRPLPSVGALSEAYRAALVDSVNSSALRHAVILPLDGVYTNGEFDAQRTAWSVSNDDVLALTKESPKLLPAASINPMRRDWEDELAKCAEGGAVLIKWLPNVMGFDPGDRKLERFYKAVIDKNIPLLSHVGFEFAVNNIDTGYAELSRLGLPLEMGVTVIAAHCCGGRPLIDSKRQLDELKRTIAQYPTLYMDVSATAAIHRRSRLGNVLADDLLRSRVVYGSDYPIPPHRWAFPDKLGMRAFEKQENLFDNDIEIKKAMGMDDEQFKRGYKVLGIPQFL
jgi:uncharacterized protein